MATNTIHHGFRCFTRHRCPQDEWIFCSNGSCVLWPCMRTGWVLETSPSDHYWRRYEVGQWLIFGWFWGWGTSDTWLARQKLGKKINPNHGGCHCPMAAMVPSPQHCCIQQLANMLHDKSMLLKLENIIIFTTYYSCYFKARRIVDVPCMGVCGLRQWAASRVLYSPWAALRVSYSQRAALRVCCSQHALRAW